MRRIHQIIQGFAPRDGTSNLTLKLRAMLRDAGAADSQVFSLPGNIAPDGRGQCLDIAGLEPDKDGALIYHFGNASPLLTRRFLDWPGKKVLVYHNFTPPEYFRLVAPGRAADLERSTAELKELAGRTDAAWAISRYNMQTLEDMGFSNLRHFPEWMDTAALSSRPAPLKLDQDETRILFVGRVAPNKNVEDLLRTFYYFKNTCPGGRKRLVIAGSGAGMELYTGWLSAMIRDMDLTRDVTFTGPVSQAELNAWYAGSHAFVCASRHEGFCIPLLEAAWFGLPVFAFDIPAVRETLAGSGVLIKEKDFRAAALLIAEVLQNNGLRAEIVAGQKKRLEDFGRDTVAARVRALLAELAGATGGK